MAEIRHGARDNMVLAARFTPWLSGVMTRLRLLPLTGLVFAALLVVLSVVSAWQMAPDRDRLEREAFAIAQGLTADELCGLTGDGQDHDHPCPFCHKLPEPGRLSVPDRILLLSMPYRPVRVRDLVRGPQHILPHVSVRGPPRLV